MPEPSAEAAVHRLLRRLPLLLKGHPTDACCWLWCRRQAAGLLQCGGDVGGACWQQGNGPRGLQLWPMCGWLSQAVLRVCCTAGGPTAAAALRRCCTWQRAAQSTHSMSHRCCAWQLLLLQASTQGAHGSHAAAATAAGGIG